MAVKLSAQLLQSVGNAVAGSGNASAPYVEETYANIPADLVDVEILQTPYGANHGYVAPSTHQDTARYRTGNTSTAGVTDFSSALDGAGQLVGTYTSVAATADGTPGTEDDGDENGRIVANPSKMKGYDYVTSSQPWAFKITVKQDLGKWYGRNIDNQVTNAADPDPSKMTDCYSNGGYKIRVNLRSRIFANNESEDWYDRLLTAPWDDLAQIDFANGQATGTGHTSGRCKTKRAIVRCTSPSMATAMARVTRAMSPALPTLLRWCWKVMLKLAPPRCLRAASSGPATPS